MKTTAVSLTVWMAQVLMTCSLNSTTNTDLSTTTLQITTPWKTIPTASLSAENFPTDRTQTLMELSGAEPGYETQKSLTSTMENTSTNTSIQSTITGPEVVTVSLNSTSVATTNDSSETGTVTRLIMQQHTYTTGLSKDIQMDRAVQTTSLLTLTSQKSTRNTEASSATASTLTLKDQMMTRDSDEVFTSTVPPVVQTEVSTEYHETTTTPQTIHLESSQNTEEPGVSTTDVSMTSEPQTYRKTVETTEGPSIDLTTNMYNVMNTTRSEDTTRIEDPTGEGITRASIDLHNVTNSTETLSTTRIETTKGQTLTSVSLNNMTNSPGTQSPTSADASYSWTTLLFTTNTSENTSRLDTTTTPWPNCYNNEKHSGRSSKLICFGILWSLGMIASIFLGLSVFLWVRLSVIKKRARLKGRRDQAGQRNKGQENLWAEHNSSAEERVEFWYANGTAIEENKNGAKRQNRRKTKRWESDEEDLWTQPKVTLQDITDFWRVRKMDVDSP